MLEKSTPSELIAGRQLMNIHQPVSEYGDSNFDPQELCLTCATRFPCASFRIGLQLTLGTVGATVFAADPMFLRVYR